MNGTEIFRGLLNRGYNPVQAAAIAGNALQESGGNPAALNAGEGANGLLQWRESRWQGLQDYAKSRGALPSDPDVQLDYIGEEMRGPESRNSSAFLAAADLASANAALKRYIRYGDNSEGTRLANATGLLNGYTGQPSAPPAGGQASSAPLSMAGPAPQVQPDPEPQQAASQPQPAPQDDDAPAATPAASAAPAFIPMLLPRRQQLPFAKVAAVSPFLRRG